MLVSRPVSSYLCLTKSSEIINRQNTTNMKRSIFLSFVLLFALVFNFACDELDVTKDITFDIELTALTNTPDFFAQELMDADSMSSAIEEYGDLIKEIDVKEVTFQITAVGDSCEATKIVTATLVVADEAGAGQETIGTIENQDIAVWPIPLPLPLNQAGVDRLAQLIKNSPHRALLTFAGSADAAPVDFTVKFVITVKMTANPL